MKTFTDNAARAWTIQVNVDALKRVKSLLDGVDLMEAVDGKLLQRMLDEPVLLCDIIYALCKPQADAASVTDEDFGRAMAGDAIDNATQALLEELVDFFPQRRRALLTKVLDKLKKLDSLALATVTDRIEKIDLDKVMSNAVAQLDNDLSALLAGKPSGPAPASSASTPAP
jgi:hypothetical protein